jgi:hypothetical protein
VTGLRAICTACRSASSANNGVLYSESALKATPLHRAVLPARDAPACSCRTSRASWSARTTRPEASPRTARRWSTRSPTPRCRSSR